MKFYDGPLEGRERRTFDLPSRDRVAFPVMAGVHGQTEPLYWPEGLYTYRRGLLGWVLDEIEGQVGCVLDEAHDGACRWGRALVCSPIEMRDEWRRVVFLRYINTAHDVPQDLAERALRRALLGRGLPRFSDAAVQAAALSAPDCWPIREWAERVALEMEKAADSGRGRDEAC